MLMMFLIPVTPVNAQMSVGIKLPGVSIGINLPLFPQLVAVPGYPVYYAPQVEANYFFYDGMYWVYQDDNWYASSWYNGPWRIVRPEVVPLFVLRIPVSYYRQPPPYFRGWKPDAPPRWGQHWGNEWEQRRNGWDKWNRRSAPAPAPLPVYQRKYSGDKYPGPEQQQPLQSGNYRFKSRDVAVREHLKQQEEQKAPPPQRTPVVQDQKQQTGGAQPQHEQQAPRMREQEQRPHDRGDSQESNRGRGQGKNRDEERGQGRDK
jgi:hypothetical protein